LPPPPVQEQPPVSDSSLGRSVPVPAVVPLSERRLGLRLHLSRRAASHACLGLVVVCVILAAGSWTFSSYLRSPDFDWKADPWVSVVLVQLDLGAENVAAAWFSSMLLLLVAGFASVCCVFEYAPYHSPRSRLSALAWLAFAGVFVLLSYDELASVHERLGSLAALNPEGDTALGWVRVLAVPITVVFLWLAAFAWLYLRPVPWVLPLYALGLLALASVPLQEHVKDVLVDLGRTHGQWAAHDIAVLVSEETELFGSLSLLAATLMYVTERHGGGISHDATKVIVGLPAARTTMAVVVCILAIGFVVMPLLPPKSPTTGSVGNPANWPGAALATLTALVCLYVHAEPRRTRLGGRFVYLLTAAWALVASAYVGSSVYAYGHWGRLYPFEVLLHAFLGLGPLVLGVPLARRVDANVGKAAAVGWAIIAAIAFLIAPSYSPYLLFVATAGLLVSLPLHLDRRARID
jgi:hypothetical protein